MRDRKREIKVVKMSNAEKSRLLQIPHNILEFDTVIYALTIKRG